VCVAMHKVRPPAAIGQLKMIESNALLSDLKEKSAKATVAH